MLRRKVGSRSQTGRIIVHGSDSRRARGRQSENGNKMLLLERKYLNSSWNLMGIPNKEESIKPIATTAGC